MRKLLSRVVSWCAAFALSCAVLPAFAADQRVEPDQFETFVRGNLRQIEDGQIYLAPPLIKSVDRDMNVEKFRTTSKYGRLSRFCRLVVQVQTSIL